MKQTLSRIAGIVGFFAAVLLFAASFACAEEARPANWAKKIESRSIQNFYQVDENLYRAAQLDQAAMAELEKLGIKTVLNLRNFHDDSDEAKGINLRLLNVPINTWSLSDAEVIAALRIIADKQNHPLLVHCQHGADRTGTIVAMYRIIFQGWSKADALKELTDGGYGFHSVWTNIPKYIQGADIGAISAAVKNGGAKRPE